MPELGAQSYTTVNGYFEKTADLTPESRAIAAKRTIDVAEQAGKDVGNMFVAGFLRANAGAIASRRAKDCSRITATATLISRRPYALLTRLALVGRAPARATGA
jgi:hypothetical protein